MHGLIFETSVCYWQNQPGCYLIQNVRLYSSDWGIPPDSEKRVSIVFEHYKSLDTQWNEWTVRRLTILFRQVLLQPIPTPLHAQVQGETRLILRCNVTITNPCADKFRDTERLPLYRAQQWCGIVNSSPMLFSILKCIWRSLFGK